MIAITRRDGHCSFPHMRLSSCPTDIWHICVTLYLLLILESMSHAPLSFFASGAPAALDCCNCVTWVKVLPSQCLREPHLGAMIYQTCTLGLRVLASPPDMSIQVLPYLRAKSCKRNCRNLPPNFFTLSQSSFSMNSRPLSEALDCHG